MQGPASIAAWIAPAAAQQSLLANYTIQGTRSPLATNCYPCKGEEQPVSSVCCLSADLAQQQQRCSTWVLQPTPARLIGRGTTSTFTKTDNVELGLHSKW